MYNHKMEELINKKTMSTVYDQDQSGYDILTPWNHFNPFNPQKHSEKKN